MKKLPKLNIIIARITTSTTGKILRVRIIFWILCLSFPVVVDGGDCFERRTGKRRFMYVVRSSAVLEALMSFLALSKKSFADRR